MGFRYTERHREEYLRDGLTILRELIPASLLADLRRETDTARELARRLRGPQTQRLQPVYAHEELDHRPFRDFLSLPGLRAAVDDLLEPGRPASDIMGVLLEPAGHAWCTGWHRDWLQPGLREVVDAGAFARAQRDPRMFNQLNGALYDDHSLWAVRGSHDRDDTDGERAVSLGPPELSDQASATERELACRAYVRGMPGAVPVVLFAGDVAFYRSCTWHLGNYVPYLKRATLHDGFYGPEDLAWQRAVRRRQAERKEASGTAT